MLQTFLPYVSCKTATWFLYHIQLRQVTEADVAKLNLVLYSSQNAVVNLSAACQDSSPDTPQPAFPEAAKQGWMNGIFGCLRPVLSIIGKGVVENRNPQGKNLKLV